MNENLNKILICSWGYSMTLVDFYQIIKETEKTVVAEKIGSKVVEGNGGYCGKVMPDLERRTGELSTWYKRGDYFKSKRHFGYLHDGKPASFNEMD